MPYNAPFVLFIKAMYMFSKYTLSTTGCSILNISNRYSFHKRSNTVPQNLVVAVIGKGNMAKTVIGGLMTKGLDSSQIILSSPSINQQPFYEMTLDGTTHKIKVAPSNQAAVEQANAVILVVKPFHAQTALSSIADALGSKPLVSAMAGITISTIRALLGLPDANITRLMPNTPATIGKGIGASFHNTPSLRPFEQEYINLNSV